MLTITEHHSVRKYQTLHMDKFEVPVVKTIRLE